MKILLSVEAIFPWVEVTCFLVKTGVYEWEVNLFFVKPLLSHGGGNDKEKRENRNKRNF